MSKLPIILIAIFCLIVFGEIFFISREQKIWSDIKNFISPISETPLPSEETTAIKETVSKFLVGRQRRNFDEVKSYLTTDFSENIDPVAFIGTSNPHIGRFEFKNAGIFSEGLYLIKVRVYEEYTGQGAIGYSDDTFYIKKVEKKYLIDNIDAGEFIEISH